MSDNGNMLLPLGIGAGILLLMTMKKKQAAETAASIPEEPETIIPTIDAGEAAAKQIEPAPAPSYAQAVTETAAMEEEEEEEQEAADEAPSGDDDEAPEYEDYDESPSGTSSSGSSFTPYTPTSTIKTDQAYTGKPVIRSIPIQLNTFARGKQVVMKKVMPQPSKSLRFQSDQAKKIAPLIAPKTKLSTTYRPGAIATKKAAIFPLKYGMNNNPYVRELQRKLGIPATGHFNSQTRTMLQKKYKVQEVNEALYKRIITGKAPVPLTKSIPNLINTISKVLPRKKVVKIK